MTFIKAPAFLAALCLTLLLAAVPARAANSYPHLFGTRETRHDGIGGFSKWSAALQRFEQQMQTSAPSSPEKQQWQALLRQLRDKPRRAQIEGVNDFFNQFPFAGDLENYGETEYWATPVEFLERGGGDCEDFAIAKYASLRALGFSAQQLRIAVVHDNIKGINHALLVVYSPDGNFVLDNQDKKVEALAAVTRYTPVFSLASDGWWLHET